MARLNVRLTQSPSVQDAPDCAFATTVTPAGTSSAVLFLVTVCTRLIAGRLGALPVDPERARKRAQRATSCVLAAAGYCCNAESYATGAAGVSRTVPCFLLPDSYLSR